MSVGWLIFIIVIAVLIIALVVLYILGRKMQKKQEVQQQELEAAAQTISLLVIDKKRMKLKDAGLPSIVYDNAPRMSKLFAKFPVAKCKVGPRVMTLLVDEKVYQVLPVRKECKVDVSGMYIIRIRSARGGLDKPVKKEKLLKRIFKRSK